MQSMRSLKATMIRLITCKLRIRSLEWNTFVILCTAGYNPQKSAMSGNPRVFLRKNEFLTHIYYFAHYFCIFISLLCYVAYYVILYLESDWIKLTDYTMIIQFFELQTYVPAVQSTQLWRQLELLKLIVQLDSSNWYSYLAFYFYIRWIYLCLDFQLMTAVVLTQTLHTIT